jgi:glutamyl-tRNA synthetase
MNKEVRVRFAPSPTGVLHIGGVRTALYNYLFAKKNNGKMILRIEDTDQSRYVADAEQYIKQSLEWCGITFDESPDLGGAFEPYRQSERKELYQDYINNLLKENKAYYAFDTPEELEAMRDRLKAVKANSLNYNSISRNTMINSLTLSNEEVEKRINANEPYVIRIKVPSKEDIRINDLVRGWVMVHSSTMDDKVLMKSDGMPTYHLANVVDDHLMKITHVIRGEEWLPSAPLHVLLYKYLGWEDSMPQFAHLPLLLKPEGNGKLSKRDAEKHGFPIFPIAWNGNDSDDELKGFKEEGFLPEAFVNFIALLGWNSGTEKELFNMKELISDFSLERINKAGAKFDYNKAIWFNQQYIKQQPSSTLAVHLIEQAKKAGHNCAQEKASNISELLKERIDVITDLYSKGAYFFESPKAYVEKVIKKKYKTSARDSLLAFAENLMEIEPLSNEAKQDCLKGVAEKNEIGVGAIMPLLRLALTGEQGGPDLMEIIQILGIQETNKRIQKAILAFDEVLKNHEQEAK